jgi:hypothetical protein
MQLVQFEFGVTSETPSQLALKPDCSTDTDSCGRAFDPITVKVGLLLFRAWNSNCMCA